MKRCDKVCGGIKFIPPIPEKQSCKGGKEKQHQETKQSAAQKP